MDVSSRHRFKAMIDVPIDTVLYPNRIEQCNNNIAEFRTGEQYTNVQYVPESRKNIVAYGPPLLLSHFFFNGILVLQGKNKD